MSIRNLKDGSDKPWLCECYPNGRTGKRIRKKFATKGEAVSFERFTMNEVIDKPWLGEKVDNRRLSEIIQRWHELHGQQLVKPEQRLRKLDMICAGMEDPIASKITVNDFANYRQMRLDGEIADARGIKQKVKPNTINHEQAYLNAVFSELKRLGEWSHPNPLEAIPLFKIEDTELAFLYPEEIPMVLTECANAKYEHLTTIVKICLATGARWSEAESLKGSQVTNNRITFVKTKGKKNRTVPIAQSLANEIPKARGQLFRPCRRSFEQAIKRTKLQLPDRQMTHVLRHTFASHFMMNGGNILVLQQILGHSDIKDTMRYAHFSPDHLDDAITKNPISKLLTPSD
ncbi:phage integrase [Shewanella surugensis]|uniref:Tyrosine-type recombinase/integrase n=1 Tax=Shewanella surugensis TaxID=212020 RepID=A0ABT0LJG5_9GAMM|nr:tyrosine-type recombinase/integrase [Shewanella surugensis]MCL1127510.1 tyrosine-type recombinase/integrase [Shewanella surugensis]